MSMDLTAIVVAASTTAVSVTLFVYARITKRFDSQDKVASKHGKALVKLTQANKAIVDEITTGKGDLEELQDATAQLDHSIRILKQRSAQHSDWLRLLAEAAGVDTSRLLHLGSGAPPMTPEVRNAGELPPEV